MWKLNQGEHTFQAEAVVHRINPITRELAASINNTPVAVYVPPGCDVTLRGERVKLRMVQPGDRVRMAYVADGALADSVIARKIEVQPGLWLSSVS